MPVEAAAILGGRGHSNRCWGLSRAPSYEEEESRARTPEAKEQWHIKEFSDLHETPCPKEGPRTEEAGAELVGGEFDWVSGQGPCALREVWVHRTRSLTASVLPQAQDPFPGPAPAPVEVARKFRRIDKSKKVRTSQTGEGLEAVSGWCDGQKPAQLALL
jgi:hypothetical protein